MQKEISKPIAIAVAAVAVLVLGCVTFFALRDKPPTAEVHMNGKVGPPPAPAGPPPAWVLEKLRNGGH